MTATWHTTQSGSSGSNMRELRNDVLTDRVRNSTPVDDYIKSVKKIIVNKLKAYDGDLDAIGTFYNIMIGMMENTVRLLQLLI